MAKKVTKQTASSAPAPFDKSDFIVFENGNIIVPKKDSTVKNSYQNIINKINYLTSVISEKVGSSYSFDGKASWYDQPKGQGTKNVTSKEYIWLRIYQDPYAKIYAVYQKKYKEHKKGDRKTDKKGAPIVELVNVFNLSFNKDGIAICLDYYGNKKLENKKHQIIDYQGKTYNELAEEIINYCNNHFSDYINNYIKYPCSPSDKNPVILPHKDISSGEEQKDDSGNNMPKCPLNLILYGPPGTGKTYNTVNRALKVVLNKKDYDDLEDRAKNIKEQHITTDEKKAFEEERKVYTDKFKELKEDGCIEFITFHQSMSYEEFVEGIKPIPTTDGKNVIYKVMPGIFKQICEEAIKPKNKNNNYVLIIDEINRGNVSQIFGELITLIEEDKRLGNKEEITIKLPYSSTTKQNDNKQGIKKEEEFGVPNNLYIIGTMNTADRSVEALDTALRRRFSFEEMMPKYTDEEAQGIECEIQIGGEKFKLSDMLWTINQRIEVLKGREQQIGHSYLMKCRTAEDLKLAFKDKIVPLLQEYFYGDYSQIALVLGEGFVKKETDEVKFAISDNAPENSTRYNLLTDEEWKQERFNLQDALEKMKIQECPLSKAQPTATSDELNDESGQDNTPI